MNKTLVLLLLSLMLVMASFQAAVSANPVAKESAVESVVKDKPTADEVDAAIKRFKDAVEKHSIPVSEKITFIREMVIAISHKTLPDTGVSEFTTYLLGLKPEDVKQEYWPAAIDYIDNIVSSLENVPRQSSSSSSVTRENVEAAFKKLNNAIEKHSLLKNENLKQVLVYGVLSVIKESALDQEKISKFWDQIMLRVTKSEDIKEEFWATTVEWALVSTSKVESFAKKSAEINDQQKENNGDNEQQQKGKDGEQKDQQKGEKNSGSTTSFSMVSLVAVIMSATAFMV
jgi:hypothetical protein